MSTITGPSHRELLADELNDRIRLESDIVGERWRRLKLAIARVQNHKDGYRRECKMLAEEQLQLKKAREEFEEEVGARWSTANLDDEAKQERYRLNIGGKRFETTAEILTRDRFSVLASLCGDFPPVAADNDGTFYFDRDGEVFQHVLNFLRTGALPEDEEILRGMFNEAAFFRLGLLRRHLMCRFETIIQGRAASNHRAAMAAASASLNTGTYASAMAMQRSQIKAQMRAEEREQLRKSNQVATPAPEKAKDTTLNSRPMTNESFSAFAQPSFQGGMPAGMQARFPAQMQLPTGLSMPNMQYSAGMMPANMQSASPAWGSKGTLPDPYGFASRSIY
eukprot:g4813.t1